VLYENINLAVWRSVQHYRGARILDVGCGTGALGELLTGHGNHVEGITHSEAEADIARTRMAAVHVLDLNRPETIAAAVDLAGFDVLVLAGVLEHLVDPVATLRGLDPLIERGVPVYVSLPNVACFYIRAGLAAGLFTPTEEGILDRTHLHHYTVRTGRRMLAEAGLHTDWMEVVPGISVWLYRGLKRVIRPSDAPKTERADIAAYVRWVYPAERALAMGWKRMLANEVMYACRRGGTAIRRPHGKVRL
jgi:SAM-dependent methyltransferase